MEIEGIFDAKSVEKFGIKLKDETKGRKGWVNVSQQTALAEEKLIEKLEALRKGDKIKINMGEDGFMDFEVYGRDMTQSAQNHTDRPEMIGYAALLKSIHKESDKLSIMAELVTLDQVKGFAQFKVTLVCEKGTFVSYGDAEKEKLAPHLKESYIRMAETRGKVRCLRDATNCATVGEDELDNPEKGPETY